MFYPGVFTKMIGQFIPGISLLTHPSGLMDIPFPFYPTGIRRSKTFVRIEIVNVYLSPFPEA